MNPTILVVEDEPAIQELIAINLKHAGFLVVRSGSAEEAEFLGIGHGAAAWHAPCDFIGRDDLSSRKGTGGR